MLNTICAVTATFIVFGTANIIACKFHISFYSVFISGPGMFFIAVSHAVKDLPFPEVLTLWSFFVLFVICILTQHSYLKPVIYLLKTYLKQYNIKSPDNLPNIVCATMFGLSLVTVTNGGEMLISLVDDIGSAMGILMITTFEAILIFGIYGMNEFCADLAFMTNNSPSIALKLLFIGGPVFIIHIIFASSLNWISPSFQNVTYPPMMYWVAWSLAMITLLILMSFAAHTIIQFIKIKDFYGSFEPTERWVPDLFHSLNQLESMAVVRKEVEYNTGNHLTFGVGRPKLCIKVDNATQTNIHHQTGNEHQNVISNQRQKHYYLEVFNGSCNDYQLERKHNENEVIIWNHSLLLEHSLDYGILEKYVQTD
ncbi:sodium-dependent noradrenaline transporter-like [Sipha flava]|uniref:Sodium-dependent noradrenaline transporter-like n=2 Tax=Sipha flava TaxID=143950 RepID=A0A8B8FBM2_9HEMI|nr:sodium-dependent noradrenaline transporter-like [Sipha flava]